MSSAALFVFVVVFALEVVVGLILSFLVAISGFLVVTIVFFPGFSLIRFGFRGPKVGFQFRIAEFELRRSKQGESMRLGVLVDRLMGGWVYVWIG